MVPPHAVEAGSTITTLQLYLTGKVQGVGFRPHVYRIASTLGIKGWVRNRRGEVEILACGTNDDIDQFVQRLIDDAPAVASPHISQQHYLGYKAAALTDRFTIIDSTVEMFDEVYLPLDLDCCPACLSELNDIDNRRYRYPFISCAQCGPRFTAISQLPYDRTNTNMVDFPRCAQCESEYHNPADRRFHAEAVACPDCGPSLTFVENDNHTSTATLEKTCKTLLAGKIVAVKGIGGYHLMCLADDDAAVSRLRVRKGRPDKPLAVMFKDIETVRQALSIDVTTSKLLQSRSGPIVLCHPQKKTMLSPLISPGLNRLGVLLPYSPLHHLILAGVSRPLITTSANISGEPVMISADEVEARLSGIADAFLHHNRKIFHVADDSVFQLINQKPRPLRLGRGHAPLTLTLPMAVKKPLLAVGGQMKNTIALAWNDHIIVSPHIGELDSPLGIELFKQTIQTLQQHCNVEAKTIVCDTHHQYRSHRWAQQSGLPLMAVHHHHAHAAAVHAECSMKGKSLIFTWDGSGLGEDGTLWGGEALLGNPGEWQRVATFQPFRLPGGEQAAREPWRCAASLCWHSGETWNNHPQAALLYSAWQKELNTPLTSSVGRLFDAAASLLGLIDHSTFEGQAAMLLQTLAEGATVNQTTALPFSIDDNGVLVSDWQPLLSQLRNQQQSASQRAINFHSTLAHTLCDQALQLRQQHGRFSVGLNGGVFQNQLLAEQAIALLEQAGFQVYLPQQLPCNDAALCYGQIIEAAACQ